MAVEQEITGEIVGCRQVKKVEVKSNYNYNLGHVVNRLKFDQLLVLRVQKSRSQDL
jgi:hypothetical protein